MPFFASGHASNFYLAFCCENSHYKMDRHPVSLRDGQTCFLMAFHVILRQILNCCFCTISLREILSVLAFYDFPTLPGSRCVNSKNLRLPDLTHTRKVPLEEQSEPRYHDYKFFVHSSFKYTLWIISTINSTWTKHRLVVRNLTSF